MSHEIHIFLGTVCIAEESTQKYPAGEKHAILFYLKEAKDSEYNHYKAKEIITKQGFDNVEFTKAGKLHPDKMATDEQKRNYENAIESGSTLILYTEPILN